MIDLSCRYLGLELSHPLMPGASPLVDDLDMVKRLEDAGASAIVMHSLFEEQLRHEQFGSVAHWESHGESFAEAQSYAPSPDNYALGPDQYLEHLRRIKGAVDVPVIASLNGVSDSGWLQYAQQIEQAGADALELNVYFVASDPTESSVDVERRVLGIVRTVRAAVSLPIAVKLSPFFSSMAHLAGELTAAGANGLILFNRFYQPELDIEALEVMPRLQLSTSAELALRVQWLAILFGRLDGASIAVSGGVHDAQDAVKAVMAGADAVQIVSALLRNGPEHLAVVLAGMRDWLEEHEYASLQQAHGSLSLARCPDPKAFERGNYIRVLQSYKR